MNFKIRVLLCTLAVVLAVLQPIAGKKGFGGGGRTHGYPKSPGLSGGGGGHGGHGGYTGNNRGTSGGSHGYPGHPGGMSGGSSGYPGHPGGMSGGSQANPGHTGGMSGGSQGYPGHTGGMSGGSQGYPGHTGGMSGGSQGHGYPAGPGLSGNTPSRPAQTNNNYRYVPPQQISYTPTHGGTPVTYPVYRGQPPTYVYQYQNSGSKYGSLLTGLALLNLGALAGAGTAYAVSHSGSGGSSGSGYKAQPGEVCKFAIKRDNGDYEETKINCELISSFIMQDQLSKQQNTTGNAGSVTTTTTVTNVTVVNSTNAEPMPPPVNATTENTVYTMFPNGTLVPFNMTSPNATVNAPAAEASNNTVTSSVIVTTTTTNTTVTDALDVKGSPVKVTPGMKCYVIRLSKTSNMRKNVECGLLQTYAEKSMRPRSPNSAAHHAPAFTIMAAIVAYMLH